MLWRRYTYSCWCCGAEYKMRGKSASDAFILGCGWGCPRCGKALFHGPQPRGFPPCPPPKPDGVRARGETVARVKARDMCGTSDTKVGNCGMRMAKDVLNMFTWSNGRINFFMGYDKSAEEILINEQALLRAIVIANPMQKPRAIKLVSADEMRKRRDTPHQKIKKCQEAPGRGV